MAYREHTQRERERIVMDGRTEETCTLGTIHFWLVEYTVSLKCTF